MLMTIEKNQKDVYKRLGKKDHNILENFYEGDSLIHVASINDHLHIVHYLLEKRNVHVDTIGYYHKTSLHWACACGHLPIVEYLISKGANIEAKDGDGWTPLHYGCERCKLPIVKYLISIGANIEAKDKEEKNTTSSCMCKWPYFNC